ncbi:MAG: IclR family transcriptional regulator [Acidobacteriota bacterium]|nr:IclR family transcriptional regulator [Acidobacteriota bacterium]
MKSVRTALRVFEEVAARQPVGLSELARTLEVPKASVQRALTTLASAGWLRYDTNQPGQWVVTARFSVLTDVDPDLVRVRQASHPHLAELQDRLGARSVGVFVLDGDRMVLLAAPDQARTVRSVEEMLGPLPVHRSAAGRVILAHLAPDVRSDLLARTTPVPDDAQSVRDLATDLARARRRGYAVAVGEFFDDLGMIAAPILTGGGAPVAGLTAVVPVDRLTARAAARVGHEVMETARAISRALEEPSATGGEAAAGIRPRSGARGDSRRTQTGPADRGPSSRRG